MLLDFLPGCLGFFVLFRVIMFSFGCFASIQRYENSTEQLRLILQLGLFSPSVSDVVG